MRRFTPLNAGVAMPWPSTEPRRSRLNRGQRLKPLHWRAKRRPRQPFKAEALTRCGLLWPIPPAFA